ncbi:MAG: hypothetical protein ABFS45_10010 [Pseudomonadota bacterium]
MANGLKFFLHLSVLLLAALIAAEMMLWKTQHPTEMKDTSIDSMTHLALPDADDLPEFRLPALRLYREITQRPLFTKYRCPSYGSSYQNQSTIQKADFPDNIELQAVFITPQKSTALLFDALEQKKLQLSENQQIDGWRIVKIASWGLILAKDSYQKILHLKNCHEDQIADDQE